ncbi:MAG: AAA family ATPase [Lachnospiraceae bacterium]|nr:AAA family ATPase [Lachnospiraceae bacterium]
MDIKFPLGYDDFSRIREENFYYVDKTGFIRELLSKTFQANLITRPRRFGKTLTLSMLKDFFDISRDSRQHFEGLKISEETELCREWMNQWPTLFLTLKSVEGNDFGTAFERLKILVANLCKTVAFLENSQKADADDRILFKALKGQKADSANLTDSLLLLTRMMNAHYGKPVILLIDEYDVPLAKAGEHGYYTEMLDVIRAMIGTVLKTNPYLKFAVVTGCLRISKESIFTGTNHFVPDTIIDERFDEYIGFTEADMKLLLERTGFSEYAEHIRAWYDGYRFGNVDVYCPWDVLNYLNALQKNPNAKPRAYWANTSENSILKKFFRKAGRTTKAEIEKLIAGDSVRKKISVQLTYEELDKTIGNLWSVLYLTGYLTAKAAEEDGILELVIPNQEIREIFITQISEWFTEAVVGGQQEKWDSFCKALEQGDAQRAESLFTAFLKNGISVRDTAVADSKKENFYHGVLLGLMMCRDDWNVFSNHEDGDGYSDIHVEAGEDTAFVMEVKYAEKDALDAGCKKAMKQMEEKRYVEGLADLGFRTIYAYGVACYKKHCKIVCKTVICGEDESRL